MIKPVINIYSHPRSGTHFIEAFVANNFYPGQNFHKKPITWGHWSNRIRKRGGNITGKLFANHKLFDYRRFDSSSPAIYIYRDGRAVAASIWNTPNFLHEDTKKKTFSEFLREPLDWYGSPATRTRKKWSVAQHWNNHVLGWSRAPKGNLLLIRYEDLVTNPDKVAKKIVNKFDFLDMPKRVDPVSKTVGLLPNKGKIEGWRELFSKEDEEFFLSQVGKLNPALYRPESELWKIRKKLSRLN